MFNTLMLCSDGSEYSLKAARVAAAIARRFESHVTLLSVFNPSSFLLPAASAPEAVPPVESILEMADEMHDEVERKTGSILSQNRLEYETERELGCAADVIVNVANSRHSELIVVGSRGLTEWKSLLLGSVSDSVLHHAHCPVFIVRGEPGGFRRILLALDGSAGANHAATYAITLAQRFRSQVTMISVREPHRHASPDEPEPLSDPLIDSFLRMKNYPGVEYAIQQETGHAADTIVRSACELGANLIVLGSRGQSAMHLGPLGSVSHRVAHHAGCSVLVVR